MHPGDQADAVFVSVSFQTQLANGFRICQDRLKDDVDRNVLCMGKPLYDLFGMFSDFLKRLRTVEMLTSGDEPYLELFQVDYHSFLPLHIGTVVIGSLDDEYHLDDEHNTERGQ